MIPHFDFLSSTLLYDQICHTQHGCGLFSFSSLQVLLSDFSCFNLSFRFSCCWWRAAGRFNLRPKLSLLESDFESRLVMKYTTLLFPGSTAIVLSFWKVTVHHIYHFTSNLLLENMSWINPRFKLAADKSESWAQMWKASVFKSSWSWDYVAVYLGLKLHHC